MGDTYTHGHHESVLRSHTWRSAENSAGYLLPKLRSGQHLLDVGCGPGTITLDLAALVAPGEVLGIDLAADVIDQAAERAAEARLANVSFAVADVYALDHGDGAFDVVHAHQVLQHLTDPVAALKEMRRVLAVGGTLAVRDSDYGGFVWAPADPRLTRWLELYHQITAHNRAEADAGRFLLGWVQAAGFDRVTVSTSTWTFADPEGRAFWGGMWADRVVQSQFATQAVSYGLSDDAELADLSEGFRNWAAQPDGFFALLHTDVLATP